MLYSQIKHNTIIVELIYSLFIKALVLTACSFIMYFRLFVALFRIAMECHANINIYQFWVLLLLVQHKDTISLATSSVWNPQWEETLSIILVSKFKNIWQLRISCVYHYHYWYRLNKALKDLYWYKFLHTLFIHKKTKSQETLLISNSIFFNQTTCMAYFHIYKKMYSKRYKHDWY